MTKTTQIKCIGIISVCIGVPVITTVVSTLTHDQTTCIFDAIGIKCLGCGMTQACYQMMQGEWAKALQANPLIVVWGILGMVFLIDEITHPRYRESLLTQVIKKAFRGIKF